MFRLLEFLTYLDVQLV